MQKIINDNVVVGVLLLIEINVEGMRYIWKRRRIIKSRYVEVEERGRRRRKKNTFIVWSAVSSFSHMT